MATQETAESRQAVLKLGRTIVMGRTKPPPPNILKILPSTLDHSWKLRKDRTGYLRSHLVLNSLYYIGHENMLDFDLTSEAVAAPYERMDSSGSRSRIQLLIVKYSNPEQARNALAHFHRAYLPDYPLNPQSISSIGLMNTFAIEDGWLGYRLYENILTIVFECPKQETARAIINKLK
jgi:hypothetical protein